MVIVVEPDEHWEEGPSLEDWEKLSALEDLMNAVPENWQKNFLLESISICTVNDVMKKRTLECYAYFSLLYSELENGPWESNP